MGSNTHVLVDGAESRASTARGSRIGLLFSRDQIQDRVRALARQIHRDYHDRDLVVVGVLTGAFVFVADLIRALHLRVDIDFVGLSSYGAASESSGAVTMTKPLGVDVRGRDVLVVEDILDTGLSLTRLLEYLRTCSPRSVRVCVLIDKTERRLEPVAADYVGFTVPEGFVVGYGIDHAGDYRYLPEICRLDVDVAP
jgi:hypoxanthine phosphoribosyltransferase